MLNLLENNSKALQDHIETFLESKENTQLLHECLIILPSISNQIQQMDANTMSPLESYYKTIYMDFVLISLQMLAFFMSQCNNMIDEAKQNGFIENKMALEQYKVDLCANMSAISSIGMLLASSTMITNPVIDGPTSKIQRDSVSDFHREVIKLTLQTISNIIYRNELGQDLLLDTGVINHILSHCATNFSNPLTREWALLTIRNACEGNTKIQTYIDSLTLQETLDLRQQGMKIEIDGKRGRFKFVQTSTEVSLDTTNHTEDK